MTGARPGADGDFSVAYWCRSCPATFRNADDANAHHDDTGHHQTWRPSESYGEREHRAALARADAGAPARPPGLPPEGTQ
jgi:hypothetical protein